MENVSVSQDMLSDSQANASNVKGTPLMDFVLLVLETRNGKEISVSVLQEAKTKEVFANKNARKGNLLIQTVTVMFVLSSRWQ